MATTRSNISPKGEEEFEKSVELKFNDTRSRNLAMELGFIASFGCEIESE
jgi:hypothetical protein